uniref:Single-stranded DNA binding protein n=1 Tax=Thorea hispida TaxID=202687 RepID=A0A1Z1XAN4_9FLOR|nr:hypothetical protein [Thorea hispida]
MNSCFLTAQIISKPYYYFLTHNMVLTYLFLRLPNPKKGKSFYYVHSFSINYSSNNIYLWYNKADYIIIYSNILYKNIQQCSKIPQKNIIINIIKSFPAILD